MMRYAARAKFTVAVVLVTTVTSGTPLRAAPLVVGDQAAWQEISAAFRKLEGMSYRMKMIAPGQTVIVERVPPNSTRMMTQIRDQVGEVESVTVGTETRARVNGPNTPGTWFCGEANPHLPPPIDLRDFLGRVEVFRDPDTVVEGTLVRSYEITSTFQGNGQTATTKTTFYIGVETGLPRRSVTPYALGPGDVVVDYYDYGTPIVISLPPCP